MELGTIRKECSSGPCCSDLGALSRASFSVKPILSTRPAIGLQVAGAKIAIAGVAPLRGSEHTSWLSGLINDTPHTADSPGSATFKVAQIASGDICCDLNRNAYLRDAGLRIDHLLLSPPLADRLVAAAVSRHVRGWQKTSDHAPVWIELGKSGKRKRQPAR
jgi:hypothetical protein